MKKFLFQAVLLLMVIIGALFLFKANPILSGLPFMPEKQVSQKVEINGATLRVEVADTQTKRNKGLGGRQELASDEGMLFIFSGPGKHPFWMKGLTFPLDFIWIKGNKVVDLIPDVPPPATGQPDVSLPVYQSKEEIDKVLEVNAGTIQRLNIKPGDIIRLTQ